MLLTTEQEFRNAHEAALTITRDIKVAKVVVIHDEKQVAITEQSFCDSVKSFTLLFNRFMGVITTAHDDFMTEMDKLQKISAQFKVGDEVLVKTEDLEGYTLVEQPFNYILGAVSVILLGLFMRDIP